MSSRERLFALEQFGIKLGLDNIRAILAALDHPEQAWRSIHIAGTNGKGSVAAMVERGLRAGGLVTGRYTSPHLDVIEERVAINGIPVDRQTFNDATDRVFAAVDEATRAGALTVVPTFFEVSTAVAFEIFRRASIDVAVVEVGLGGRFDATNVLNPDIAVITSIAFDHERHLGTTLSQIAFEKAGIAKPGTPLVLGRLPDEAARRIAEVAAAAGAPLIDANANTGTRAYPPLKLALNGRHQLENAAVAVAVLETWSARNSFLATDAIVTGLTDCQWPARLEWLRLANGGQLLIDAAHNPAGAAALATYLAGHEDGALTDRARGDGGQGPARHGEAAGAGRLGIRRHDGAANARARTRQTSRRRYANSRHPSGRGGDRSGKPQWRRALSQSRTRGRGRIDLPDRPTAGPAARKRRCSS